MSNGGDYKERERKMVWDRINTFIKQGLPTPSPIGLASLTHLEFEEALFLAKLTRKRKEDDNG